MSAKKPEDRAPLGGVGFLMCQVCDRPIRDHEVGARCPKWDGILNARLRATYRGNTPGHEAEKKRKWRAANPGRN